MAKFVQNDNLYNKICFLISQNYVRKKLFLQIFLNKKFQKNFKNSYLFNSFSLFGCETNRSNCEWLVFPKSRGIRENGLENPYFGISRRRRRREIVKGFERPFSLIPSDLGKTSFTVRKVCRTPKKGQMNWTDNFFKFYQYFCVIMNTLISLKVNCWVGTLIGY